MITCQPFQPCAQLLCGHLHLLPQLPEGNGAAKRDKEEYGQLIRGYDFPQGFLELFPSRQRPQVFPRSAHLFEEIPFRHGDHLLSPYGLTHQINRTLDRQSSNPDRNMKNLHERVDGFNDPAPHDSVEAPQKTGNARRGMMPANRPALPSSTDLRARRISHRLLTTTWLSAIVPSRPRPASASGPQGLDRQ